MNAPLWWLYHSHRVWFTDIALVGGRDFFIAPLLPSILSFTTIAEHLLELVLHCLLCLSVCACYEPCSCWGGPCLHKRSTTGARGRFKPLYSQWKKANPPKRTPLGSFDASGVWKVNMIGMWSERMNSSVRTFMCDTMSGCVVMARSSTVSDPRWCVMDVEMWVAMHVE